MLLIARFDFPRGSGAYAPRFCGGPLDFSDKGPKIACILTRNPVFDHYFFYQKAFQAPSLKSDPEGIAKKDMSVQ